MHPTRHATDRRDAQHGLAGRMAVTAASTLGALALTGGVQAPSAQAQEETAGVHRAGAWLLRASHGGGPADRAFTFGRAGDEPLVGDWNGDGRMTVGVRRGATFHLRDSNSGGAADHTFTYGTATDTPVVGDVDGDGATTVGVHRDGRFLLRTSLSGGPADLDYWFGGIDDTPLLGDWSITPSTDPGERVVSDFSTPLVPGQDRNHNLHLASDYLDGSEIAPGETFSLNEAIGPRTAERGFVPNGFIDDDGELISVVGGGVSQMGTTFLNAAWFAGVQIDEFRSHTLYFDRYPMCREATLTWGELDVVITNDSPYPITVETDYSQEHVGISFVSQPWAEVSTWTSDPYGHVGSSFRVDCERTVTYPDGTTSTDSHSWRYDDTG